MLETALVIGILLTTVFFIVEYTQYLFTRNMLEETVYQVGRKVAVVPNLDVDYRRIDTSDPRYRRAIASRRMAVERGEAFLKSVFASHYEEEEQPPFLSKLTQRFPARNGEDQIVEGPIAILLAGECVTRPDGSSICNSKPFGGDDSENFPPVKADLSVMATEFPIRVLVDVELPSTVGILPTHKFQVQTYVYRQPIPESPFSEEIELAIGNLPLAAEAQVETPSFSRPVANEEEDPDWSLCPSPVTGQPMTEAEMAKQLIECSNDSGGKACRFVGCQPVPK